MVFIRFPSFFISALFVILSLPSLLLATAQRPNRILFEGKEYELCDDPMEAYFKRFPERLPTQVNPSSNLWRGYLATFEVTDSVLFLQDIEASVKAKTEGHDGTIRWQSVLGSVVPNQEKLRIDWVNGLLIVRFGEYRPLDYDEYDCTLRYEGYIVLEIKDGMFVRSKRMGDFDKWMKFREDQFRAFKRSQEYANLVKKMRADGRREPVGSLIKEGILSYSKKILVR